MNRFMLVVALSLLAAACSSSTPMQSRWEAANGRNFPEPEPGLAALYLVRDAAPPDAAPINITMGRQPVGGLAGGTWMLFNLPPGLCDLRAFGPDGSTELVITPAPGETRFLLVQPTAGGAAELLEMSKSEGRRLVRQGQHIQEIR